MRTAIDTQRTRVLPYLVLGIALVATIATTVASHRSALDRDHARFRNAVQSADDRIHNRLDTYVAVLLAARGLVAAAPDVDRQAFKRFVGELELERRYPGIQGIGFSRRLAPSDRAALERRMRAQGDPSFRVWPEGDRSELHSILFLEPLDRRNQAAIGFDMSTESVRREAMERARDTGLPAASGRVRLVQEIDAAKQWGFLLYVPVYEGGQVPPTVEERRARLVGFVYSPFRADDLFGGIFGSEREPRVRFDVYDGPDTSDDTLIHSSMARDGQGRLAATTRIDIAGRTWTIEFHSASGFERRSNDWLWPYVFGAGLLISGLLFALSRLQARAQEQLRLHSLVLASMSEGVSVSDEDGIIRYTNPAEDAMFGYARGELIGRHVTVQNTYPPEENRRIVERVIAELRRRGEWRGEFANARKDGTPFPTLARITALRAGGRCYWVCVQEDITVRKQVEAERAASLARETALRTAAEHANRAKDEFLAMLGHELRNPLAPIVTAIDLLRRRGGTLPREHAIIDRQVRHLSRLLDDLLDVSRITRGKVALDKRRIELASVVAQAVEAVGPLVEERRHQLVVEVPAEGLAVDADPARLTQVIANLLTNAAKYTDRGGRVEVRAARQGDRVALSVRDNGIGILPDMLPRIFELFVQGPRTVDRSAGGLGIGLTLARNLVELHGGTIEARSDGAGRGSEFQVMLPAAQPQAVQHAQLDSSAGEPHSSAPRRVLVVDDNRDAADTLADYLRAAGHAVEVAYDAVRALEVAPSLRPEVAILDIGLPVMDGYELAARLSGGPRPTLIALTGYGQSADAARSLAAGFDYHVVKPVDPRMLLEMVAAA